MRSASLSVGDKQVVCVTVGVVGVVVGVGVVGVVMLTVDIRKSLPLKPVTTTGKW